MASEDNLQLGIYEHYKGKQYQVIGIGKHTETLEEFVIYKPLYDLKKNQDVLWIRPKKMFLEKVSLEGKLIQRFRFLKSQL
jgi:hypothetical protein